MSPQPTGRCERGSRCRCITARSRPSRACWCCVGSWLPGALAARSRRPGWGPRMLHTFGQRPGARGATQRAPGAVEAAQQLHIAYLLLLTAAAAGPRLGIHVTSMSSSALLIPSRSLDGAQEGLLSPRGACLSEHRELLGKSPRGASFAEQLKPAPVSGRGWLGSARAAPRQQQRPGTRGAAAAVASRQRSRRPRLAACCGRHGRIGAPQPPRQARGPHGSTARQCPARAARPQSLGRRSSCGEGFALEAEAGLDAASVAKLRGHWLLPAVGKPAAAAVLMDLGVQRIPHGARRARRSSWRPAGRRRPTASAGAAAASCRSHA